MRIGMAIAAFPAARPLPGSAGCIGLTSHRVAFGTIQSSVRTRQCIASERRVVETVWQGAERCRVVAAFAARATLDYARHLLTIEHASVRVRMTRNAARKLIAAPFDPPKPPPMRIRDFAAPMAIGALNLRMRAHHRESGRAPVLERRVIDVGKRRRTVTFGARPPRIRGQLRRHRRKHGGMHVGMALLAA